MFRVDQIQDLTTNNSLPANALQKLEDSFLVHKERMEKVMQYLDAAVYASKDGIHTSLDFAASSEITSVTTVIVPRSSANE